MRRRGTVCRGVPASAGYGNGAALQITALVAGAGSILHDRPRAKRITNWRGRGSWGTRGSRCSGVCGGATQRWRASAEGIGSRRPLRVVEPAQRPD